MCSDVFDVGLKYHDMFLAVRYMYLPSPLKQNSASLPAQLQFIFYKNVKKILFFFSFLAV
jgi:hypothetical protein